MSDPNVIIVGAGPTGLMLGAELTLAGIPVLVIERRAERERVQPGALGLHAGTLEIFDQRGIADRFLAEGKPAQVVGFAGARLDISAFPTRFPFGLSLIQRRSEQILGDWAAELGVPVQRGIPLSGVVQDADGVSVTLEDGRTLRCQYLVGCDGGRSGVRKAAGIAFPGSDPTVSHLLAQAELSGDLPYGLRSDAIGTHALSPAEDGLTAIMVTEEAIGTGPVTLETLRAAMVAHYGTDFSLRNPRYITRFTDMTRQAETYRKGRIFLAGDAAHIHYPAGGFGMGIGIADAVNLGWKLALVTSGVAPDGLLDSYHTERHPAAARLLRYTLASVALARPDDRSKATAAIMAEMLQMDAPAQAVAGEMSGLAIHYDLGGDHPLVGRRMPDLDLTMASGPRRLYQDLHTARPLLVGLGKGPYPAAGPWSGRVTSLHAAYDGPWNLPVIGSVAAPTAVQVRPDGYVAWVGQGSDAGLSEALERWYGPA